MPNVEDLSPKDRAAFLGCIKAKNKKWRKDHEGKDPPQSVLYKHFRECSVTLGYEN